VDFDILDPQLYATDPFPVYRWLRANAPVYRDEKHQLWLLSKYADVAYVSKNPKLFCSRFGVTPDADVMISLVTMDDPRHAQLRAIISRGFTPRMVAQLQPRIREVVAACIDAVIERGECDFVRDLAVPVPMLVIAELIGIRPDDRDRFWHWSDTMMLAAGQHGNQPVLEKAAAAYVEYADYLQEVFSDRRQNPRSDLVSVLLAAQQDGRLTTDEQNLSADELLQFMTLLLVAGNETTRNAMSGGMLAFCEHRGEWRRLVDNPALVPAAVEEVLRWVTPVVGFRRTATADTELHGRAIRAGDKVLMIYQSANRDEDVFDEPDRLRIDRDPNEHLAFGIGTHFCLGASLARLELRVLFEELIRRLPDLRLAPGAHAERLSSLLVRGIARMPMVFTPQRGRSSAAAHDSQIPESH